MATSDAETTGPNNARPARQQRRQRVPAPVIRRAMTAAGVLTMLLGVAGWSVTAGADPIATPADPAAITVTYVPAAGTGGCVTPALAYTAATATTFVSGSTWTVTITAQKAFCDPVTAAVYAMPENPFWPWPQRKVDATTFEIGPGVTTITFARTCGPLQFDVVTGATPASINPVTGPMPGPLLFTNPWTGFQSWKSACATSPSSTSTSSTTSSTSSSTSTSTSTSTSSTSTSTSTSTSSTSTSTSTSTSSTSTSTTSTSTTTTTEAGVLPTSTIAATSTTSTTQAPVLPNVLGATTTIPQASVEAATSLRTPSTGTAVQPALAKTGTTERPYELVGALLIVAGGALTIVARRRFS